MVNENVARAREKFDSDILNAVNDLVRQLVADNPLQKKDEKEQGTEGESEATVETEPEAVIASGDITILSTIDELNESGNDIYRFRGYFEVCSDLLFRWRQLNESPNFMLELLRAVKLTETESGIYTVNPDIAVQIKRTIGNIAKINKNFDFTSRVAMESILSGEYPRSWLSRQEKQLADLRNRLIMLKDLNNRGSQALGLGLIDRSADYPDYSSLINFKIIQRPDKYEMK